MDGIKEINWFFRPWFWILNSPEEVKPTQENISVHYKSLQEKPAIISEMSPITTLSPVVFILGLFSGLIGYARDSSFFKVIGGLFALAGIGVGIAGRFLRVKFKPEDKKEETGEVKKGQTGEEAKPEIKTEPKTEIKPETASPVEPKAPPAPQQPAEPESTPAPSVPQQPSVPEPPPSVGQPPSEPVQVEAKEQAEQKLIDAAFWGYLEKLRELLRFPGIDVNAKDKWEETALIYAAENGHVEVVKVLREDTKVDVNAKDKWERTALMWAASRGFTEIVKELLQFPGIDVNVKTESGLTALRLAELNHHDEVAELLKGHIQEKEKTSGEANEPSNQPSS